MSDVDLTASLRWDGSEDQLAAVLTSSISGAFKGLGPDLAADFVKAFRSAFGGIDDIAADFAKAFKSAFSGIDDLGNQAFTSFRKGARTAAEDIRDIEDALRQVGLSADALKGGIREGFDPKAVNFFKSALDNVIQLQDELLNAKGDPEALLRIGKAATLARSELVGTVKGYQQVALASREAAQNSTRDTRQASKEKIAVINDEKARFVVATQTAAAKETAIIRSSAQLQVAETQAAAKRRAAAFQLVGRVVQSVERGIRTAFQATARVVSTTLNGISRLGSSAFSGIGRAATAAGNTLSSVFRRANRSTVNNFDETNSSITNTYKRSFRRNTNIVNNELNQQESRVKRFAEEASSSIGGMSLGKLGGFAAVGALAGRALRGGFERAATLEDSERALTTLLGSVEEAQKLRDGVLDVVTGTPFKLDQFADAATQLVAFNLEADKIPRVLSAIADAAAVRGGNAGQTIDSLVDTFGQITATGRLMGDDLNRIAAAGVPALQILGNAYGKTGEEMRDMISKGAVPAAEAIQILTDGILDGSDGVQGATSAFAGLAQELGGTLRGSIGNFGAAMDRLGANVITLFGPQLVAIVQSATAGIDLLGKMVMSVASAVAASPVFKLIASRLEGISASIKASGDRLKPVFDFLGDGIVTLLTAVGGLAALRRIPLFINVVGFALRRLLTPMNLLIGAGLLVSSFLTRLVRENPELSSALKALGNSFQRIATIVTDLAADAFGFLSSVLEGAVVPAISFLADKVESAVVPALEALNRFLIARVIPAFRTTAKFIRTDVLPVIGKGLARAVEIGRTAFDEFVKFIRVAFRIFTQGDDAFLGYTGWLSRSGPVVGGLFRIREAFEQVVKFAQAAFGILINGGTQLGSTGWLRYDGPVVGALFRLRGIFREVFQFIGAAVTILWRGDEFTTGTGWLSEDGIIIRGLNNIRSAMESVVNFTKSNLTPVLIGVGTALGTAALSGGNIPLAGLAGATAGIVAALSNDDIRNALIDTVKKGVAGARKALEDFVEGARETFKNLIDSGTLAAVGVNVLKVARKIGEVLGDILTDRRLLALVAGIAAFAAVLAGSFALGFVEGVIGNIPDIVRGLNKALTKALGEGVEAAARNPAIAAAIVGGILGAATIARLVLEGRKVGKVLSEAVSQGAVTRGAAVTSGSTGVGGGQRGFINGLFGGPRAVQAAGAAAGQKYGQALVTAIRNEARVIDKLGGNRESNLRLGPVPGERFADQNRRFAGQLKELRTETGRLEGELGKAAVAGVRLGDGLERAGSKGIRQGFAQIRTAVKDAGKQMAGAAGTVAGGAFMASFISRAIFDVNSSGTEKLGSALGTLAVSIATYAQIGGKVGVVAGAAVGGFGLITSKLQANSEQAKLAKQRIEEYAEAIRKASKEELPDLFKDRTEEGLLNNLGEDALKILSSINFDPGAFGASIANQTVGLDYGNLEKDVEAIRDVMGKVGTGNEGRAGMDFLTALSAVDLGPLASQLIAAQVPASTVAEILGVLAREAGEGASSISLAATEADFLAGSLKRADLAANNQGIRDWAEAGAGAIDVASTATKAYRDKLNELNDVRIQGLKDKVDEARSALDVAGQAADTAKEKLRQFLAGENLETSIAEQTNNAVIAVDGLATRFSTLDPGKILNNSLSQVDFSTLENGILEVQGIAAGLLLNVDPADPTAVANALLPLKVGILQSDTSEAVKGQLLSGVDAAIAAVNSEPGKSLVASLFNAEADIPAAQAGLEVALRGLDVGAALPPEMFSLIVAEAELAFGEAGKASSDGYIEKFDTEAMKKTAAAAVTAALKAAASALGIESPSTKYALLGRQSVAGYVKGMREALDTYKFALNLYGKRLLEGVEVGITNRVVASRALVGAAVRSIVFAAGVAAFGAASTMARYGRSLFDGFIAGMNSRRSAAYATAASIARGTAAAVSNELRIRSPSKVMEGLGRQTMEGFAAGISESTSLAVQAASEAMNQVVAATNATVGGGFDVNVAAGVDMAREAAVSRQAESRGMATISPRDIDRIVKAIGDTTRAPVQIDQTFNEPVDSRAMATDIAWRLSG